MPAKSKSQQRLMGMVHACQKTGQHCSGKIDKIAKSMKKKAVTDFAKTSHKKLPERVNEHKKTRFKDFLCETVHDIEAVIRTAYQDCDKTREDFVECMKRHSGHLLTGAQIRRMMRSDPEFAELNFVD